MILKIRQSSEKKEAMIGAKIARQVPAAGRFLCNVRKSFNRTLNRTKLA